MGVKVIKYIACNSWILNTTYMLNLNKHYGTIQTFEVDKKEEVFDFAGRFVKSSAF